MVDFDGLEAWDCFKGLQRAIHRAHCVYSALHCDVRPYQWLGVPHLDYPDRVRGTARLVYLGGFAPIWPWNGVVQAQKRIVQTIRMTER